jgi:hypothetical protein
MPSVWAQASPHRVHCVGGHAVSVMTVPCAGSRLGLVYCVC